VSASMEFILDSKSTSHDLSFITSTTVEAYIETIDARSINNVDDTLLSDLVRFRDEDNLHGFVQKYGTHYISGMKYGGSAQSRLTISATSQKVKEEFAGSLTAAYKSVGSSGSAKYKEELSRVMERSDTRTESSYYLEGHPLPGMKSTDIDVVLAALDQFGKEIDNRHNDRNPYPLSVICDEWETIREIRDILGDKTLLPHVADGAINAITSEYGALSWASDAAYVLKRSTIWNQTPNYIQESFRKQNGEYIGSVQSDMKRIRDLSFADLSVLEPNSTEFDELFGQASVYEKKINELSDGQLRVKWSFITAPEIEYNGPLNGSVAVNFDKTISGEPDGYGYGEIFSATIGGDDTPFSVEAIIKRWELGASYNYLGTTGNSKLISSGGIATLIFKGSELSVSFI
jgi:hypothetical protein